MTEDAMVAWHHRPNGHEFEQALGDGEGQGGLACCSPRGCKELDMTEQLQQIKYTSIKSFKHDLNQVNKLKNRIQENIG